MKFKKINILIGLGLILLSVLFAGCSGGQNQTLGAQTVKGVSTEEAETLINDNGDLTIIDVRTPQEYASGHLPRAINLDYRSQTFKKELERLDKNKVYLVYCQSGSRSQKALDVMKELGFRQVYNLTGGISGWSAEGFPTEH